MATTEKATEHDTEIEADVVAQPVSELQSELQLMHEQMVGNSGMSRQSIITVSIISAILLFFLGMGLGFLMGNREANGVDNNRARIYNQSQLPGGTRRGHYYQNGNQTTPSQDTTNNNTQTN